MNPVLTELQAREARDGLWERRVAGYPVWPSLRLAMYRAGMLAGEVAIRPAVPPSRARLPRQYARAASDIVRQGMPPRDGRDIWVLSSSSYRRRLPDGSYPCIFTEHLERQLGPRLRYVEANVAGLPLAGRPDIFLLDGYQRSFDAAASAAARVLPQSAVARDTQTALAPTTPSELLRRALYGQALQRFAAALLLRDRPRAVFVLCAYASMIPIQRAVRAAGIPLIELQHGVIHDSHPGYVFGPHVPLRDHRPDHLVLFGRHFGELLDEHSPKLAATWSVGGHPWLKKIRAEATGAAAKGDARRPLVVVFGQYDPPVQAQLKVLVPALRRCLPAECDLIYKPHPRELTEALTESFTQQGVRLADNADDSYRLLARCTLAVSVYSTLATEALAFGCKSVVVRSPLWTEEIRDLVEGGVLYAADTAEDIVRVLRLPDTQEQDLTERLWGVASPEPDFEALVEQVRARIAAGR